MSIQLSINGHHLRVFFYVNTNSLLRVCEKFVKRRNCKINVGNKHACYIRDSYACEIFAMHVKVFVLHVNLFLCMWTSYNACEIFFAQVKRFCHVCKFFLHTCGTIWSCMWTFCHRCETFFSCLWNFLHMWNNFLMHVNFMKGFPSLYTVQQIHTGILDIKSMTTTILQVQLTPKMFFRLYKSPWFSDHRCKKVIIVAIFVNFV